MLIALAVAAAATTTVLARVQSPSQDELDKQFLAAWAQQIRADVRVPAAGAKLVVVKFNDWMCPGCRLAYQEFKPLLAKYQAMPGVLKYVEKDWPWNTACNQAATQTFGGHEASCNAAAVVRLAAGRGKRDLMIDWLFANQPQTMDQRKTMPDRVKAKAMEMLGVTDFAAAYAATLPEVRKDVADGIALNIRSTPTYFINGIRAVGADESTIPGHYFELALRYEYQKNGGR
jgi:protein-disulfide isomerase